MFHKSSSHLEVMYRVAQTKFAGGKKADSKFEWTFLRHVVFEKTHDSLCNAFLSLTYTKDTPWMHEGKHSLTLFEAKKHLNVLQEISS